MQLAPPNETPEGPRFAGTPLSVVFTDGERLEDLRKQGKGSVPLSPPFHVSDEDLYLLLPDDIGLEIIDIMQDGDFELLHEAMRDGLLVEGSVESEGKGVMALNVELCASPTTLLKKPHYAATVLVGGDEPDPVETANSLEHARCTMSSSLLDDTGLEKILRRREYLGMSWQLPSDAPAHLSGAEPTYIWSKRLQGGEVGIELALFSEYEELVAVFRPAKLAPA